MPIAVVPDVLPDRLPVRRQVGGIQAHSVDDQPGRQRHLNTRHRFRSLLISGEHRRTNDRNSSQPIAIAPVVRKAIPSVLIRTRPECN